MKPRTRSPEPQRAVEGEPASPTAKGERTREQILSTALRLFRDQGYEETSMRAIAEASGVSVGNAYHYFDSKEHLVQAFYEQTHREHLEKCEPRLERERALAERLRVVLLTKIETAEPYHHLSALLFRTAIDPKSPLSPFSAESAPLRDEATALMRRVVEGSKQRVPDDLSQELPSLLWMFEMSIILFWIHDESPGRKRTRHLIDRTCKLVARLVTLASFPLLKPLRSDVLGLMAELREESEAPRAKPHGKTKKGSPR
jgi:AcrR family transcriptional regulator